MADRTRFVYCEAREVKVDLDRGFHGCIQDNQCFSDEPWPLDGRFLEPRCKIKAHREARHARSATLSILGCRAVAARTWATDLEKV